jgi:hypothetical protein
MKGKRKNGTASSSDDREEESCFFHSQNWLNALSIEVDATLKQLLKACLKEADPVFYPSQILCLAESITFTCRCEDAIKSGKLNSFLLSLQVDIR